MPRGERGSIVQAITHHQNIVSGLLLPGDGIKLLLRQHGGLCRKSQCARHRRNGRGPVTRHNRRFDPHARKFSHRFRSFLADLVGEMHRERRLFVYEQ